MTEAERQELAETVARSVGREDCWLVMVIDGTEGALMSNIRAPETLLALLESMAAAIREHGWEPTAFPLRRPLDH